MVNAIPKSARSKNIWAAFNFENYFIRGSAILGPNPFTGKVELKQETVVFRGKRVDCNVENNSYLLLSFVDFNYCNVTMSIVNKHALRSFNIESYL